MKLACIALAGLLAVPAVAKDKAPDSAYQEAVLVKFTTVTTGTSCSHSASTTGDVDATTSDDGNTTGTVKATTSGSTDCSDVTRRHYTLAVGQQTFVIEPEPTKGQKGVAMATLGWSAAFAKQSVLADQLPGTHVRVRSDGSGFCVKLGKRESRYSAISAQ